MEKGVQVPAVKQLVVAITTGSQTTYTLKPENPTQRLCCETMRQTNDTNGVNGSGRTIEPGGDKTAPEPIAIIGMSCKFPGGATSPDKLWRMCIEGRDGWSEIPKSRFNAAAFFDEDHEKTSSVSSPHIRRSIDTAMKQY
jgi:hypothetical protein